MSPNKKAHDSLLKTYDEKGYAFVENLFSKQECEALIAASHELPSFKEGSFVPVMNAHSISPLFFEVMKEKRILEIVSQLIHGHKVSGLMTEMFFCRPGTPGFSPHQDNYFVQAKLDAFCSLWLPLEDVSRENGTLIIYPGSQKEGMLQSDEIQDAPVFIDQDPNAQRRKLYFDSEKYRPMDVEVKAGTGVFFHSCLIHASHKNQTPDRHRHVLLITYIRSGEPFRAGNYAKRTAIPLT